MPRPTMDAMFGRPEWLENFRAWAARLPPATIAKLIDVLALELRERDVAPPPPRGEAADPARERQLIRVQQLVDDFLLTPTPPAREAGAPEDLTGS